jgi:outer membrane lipopolysaccharide assembly protein LptE/RlpB
MMMTMNSLLRCAAAAALFALTTGCVQQGLTDVMQRPAERALLGGLRAYEDGQYAEAERALQESLKTGLVSAKDRANANKHLAFIYCTSQRAPACEAAFREARNADHDFTLSKAETGHPQWGPVYKKVASAAR